MLKTIDLVVLNLCPEGHQATTILELSTLPYLMIKLCD